MYFILTFSCVGPIRLSIMVEGRAFEALSSGATDGDAYGLKNNTTLTVSHLLYFECHIPS